MICYINFKDQKQKIDLGGNCIKEKLDVSLNGYIINHKQKICL